MRLTCGNSTKVVTGVEVSGRTAHDANHFVPLVERTAAHSDLERVSGDKAYLSKKNVQAVADAGAVPFVPFRSNSLPPAEDPAWSRMYHLFVFDREEFLRHHNGRSSAESAFSMVVRAKFGDSIRPKSDTGQVNEALCKVLCHNVCVPIPTTHSLGVEASFAPSNVAYLPRR